MKHEEFPALFLCADAASNSTQANYLRLVKAEYGVLFICAILSMPFLKVQRFIYYTRFCSASLSRCSLPVLFSSWNKTGIGAAHLLRA